MVDDVRDGNASAAGSFVVGDTFWLELLVAGGVDGSIIFGEGARMPSAEVNARKMAVLVIVLKLGEERFNAIALLTSTSV